MTPNQPNVAQLIPLHAPRPKGVTMRIQLDDPSRVTELRDYFLRLGANAVVNEDSTVEVCFAGDDEVDARRFLRTWAATNEVSTHTVGAGDEPTRTPAVRPEVEPRGATPADPPVRLGDLMVSKGFINNEQLSQALVESRESGELVGRVLLRRRWVFEDELARTLAEQWRIPYVRLSSIGVDHQVMRLLPREVGLRYAAVPVRFAEQSVLVAFADPSDPEALAAARTYLPRISLAVAEFTDIRMLWQTVGA